ncbi:MAG: prepilin-type N-terminal cleavage/methylation domain-containing protein [Gammaproteobacteria bacterium]|nr:prepilin-type N-terminal cleavage/methylation domain-containing protein [Gammaproteobacteria bacterium]
MHRSQSGFTLVEIAIVLVIIGLLLGGILKGQELINSARVRNLADTTTGIQAAYYGFIDRYRRVPGDWKADAATKAIGTTITGGGNDNGRLDDAAGVFAENNGMWEQLAKAGFIQGNFNGTADEPSTNNDLSPLNAYNNVIVMGRTDDYLNASSVRLYSVFGRGVPVNVMRELDVKLDDGKPAEGDVRATKQAADVTYFAGTNKWGGAGSNCTVDDSGKQIWDVQNDAQDCNAVYLY